MMMFVTAVFTMEAYGCRKCYCKCCQLSTSLLHYVYLFILVVTRASVPYWSIISTATSTSHTRRPSASAETAASEQNVICAVCTQSTSMSID